MTTLQPEIDLLLTCARTHLQAEHADALRTRLSDDLDWDEVVRLARQHAVLPLLYHQLKTLDSQAVPRVAWNQLQHRFRANLRRNLSMTAELLKLQRMLEAHGIAAIPYKGPVLAAAVYGDVALRQFVDLDLLVHRQDLLKVKSLLLSQGYQEYFSLAPAQESIYLQTGCELSLQHPTKHIWIDLHWHIVRRFNGFPLPLEPLWDRLQPLCLGGQQIDSLAPEDLLLILCIHNGKHHWDRLGWLCDVAQLLRRYPQMHWEPLIDQAIRIGAARMLWIGLYLAHDLLGTPLPDRVGQRMQADPVVPTLAAQLYKDLLQASPQHANRLTRFSQDLKMRERWWDRIRYGYSLSLAVSIEDFTSVQLPSYLSGLYYGLRPLRLLGRYMVRFRQW